MDKKTLIEKLARESHEKGGLNGAWLYAENGVIVSKGALGFRDPENTLPLTEETRFQLASVSKTFTGTAAVLLMRQGLLSPEDKLAKFFPELTAYADVTVRQLLNHTGGVPDYFEDVEWFIKILREEKRVPGNAEILRFLCETGLEPLFAPGEKFEYSNTGYNLLALLVERLSGIPYEEFLQKYIFEPAGMTSTRCCHIRRDGVPFDDFARPTVLEDGRYVADIDSSEGEEVTAVDGLNGDDYVFTNVSDMLRWDRALREGKVLTPEELWLAYTPGKLNDGSDACYDDDDGYEQGYGFGWGVGRDERFGLIVSHSGGMPGVATWFERFIDADRVIVILVNREPEDYRAFSGFWKGVRQLAMDREPAPIRSLDDIMIKDSDTSKWESFCGKYEHPEDDDYTVDEVFLRDGALYVKVIDDEAKTRTFRLYPIGEDEFGRKGGMLNLKFGDGCVTYDGESHKKLQ